MNNILTPKRNALSSKHLSSLLFINCSVGPPVKLFIPSAYVQALGYVMDEELLMK